MHMYSISISFNPYYVLYCMIGIAMQAYAPLGSPGRFQDMINPNDPVVLKDPVINEIALKHGASPAQVGTMEWRNGMGAIYNYM